MLKPSLMAHGQRLKPLPIGASVTINALVASGNGAGCEMSNVPCTINDHNNKQKESDMKKAELVKAEQKLADKLRDCRLKQGLTQDALADKSGLDRKTVNRIERNHFSPSLRTLLILCDSLDVKVSEVVK